MISGAVVSATILCEAYAGLQAQALGLAEAAGWPAEVVELRPRFPWSWVTAPLWPAPLHAVGMTDPPSGLLISAGGSAAAVAARLRRRGAVAVQVQNPRTRLDRFDVVVANRHDEIAGPNVVTLRTALHRATGERLAAARKVWAERLMRPGKKLVSVLVGGSNGRKRLDAAEGNALATALLDMVRRDEVAVAVTPSRRTPPEVRAALTAALAPVGGWVWDMAGENPYFGLLACADAIVATEDSVSMVSEAAATSAPVLVARLPGRSRRIGLFLDGLRDAGRIRDFAGRLEMWDAAPLDDTPYAAAEVRRRLGFADQRE